MLCSNVVNKRKSRSSCCGCCHGLTIKISHIFSSRRHIFRWDSVWINILIVCIKTLIFWNLNTSRNIYTCRRFHQMSHLMRLWYFSSSVNSFFKRACAAIQWGLDVWFLVGPFIYFHTSSVRTAKALARLRGRTGSPEPSLVAYVLSTIISWAGSYEPFRTNWRLKS